jgi:hypothetical protein
MDPVIFFFMLAIGGAGALCLVVSLVGRMFALAFMAAACFFILAFMLEGALSGLALLASIMAVAVGAFGMASFVRSGGNRE